MDGSCYLQKKTYDVKISLRVLYSDNGKKVNKKRSYNFSMSCLH
jgi:hypothetical protein